MTASHVDGVEVVASEAAVAPISKKDGSPILYTQTVKLLLADGREVYGCVHCDFTAEKLGGVRPHLRIHKPPTEAAGMLPEDMTIGELFREHQRAEALAGSLDEMTASRNEWRSRARDAEKQLHTLRTALRGAL